MSKHLSPDRLAKVIVGRVSDADRRHVVECAECLAEIERFGAAVATFRGVVRNRVEARVLSQSLANSAATLRPAAQPVRLWRWAFLTACFIAVTAGPFLLPVTQSPSVDEEAAVEAVEIDANELMNAIDLHLSRALPTPMEPAMALMPLAPLEETIHPLGGVQ
jgi:hypothetical protein